MISHSKPQILEADIQAVCDQLASGEIDHGAQVSRFEKAVANYLGVSGGIATSNGASALFLALKVLDVGLGDEVIIPTYVCREVFDAVVWTGATPVLADVGVDWCLNVAAVTPHITRRTKAIIVVHIFGISADIEPIVDLGIPVIEDCAQALGGTLNGRRLASFGTLAVCSFQATKLLSTGEGGMVLSRDQSHLERVRRHGQGMGMSNIQAALGLSQLGRYEAMLSRRLCIAKHYLSALRHLPIQLPIKQHDRSVYFRFPIRSNMDFCDIKRGFEEKNIQVRRGVDTLLHRELGFNSREYPSSEGCYRETVSLPIYPALTDSEVSYVADVASEILNCEGSKAYANG